MSALFYNKNVSQEDVCVWNQELEFRTPPRQKTGSERCELLLSGCQSGEKAAPGVIDRIDVYAHECHQATIGQNSSNL